jgi:hypothetical protein
MCKSISKSELTNNNKHIVIEDDENNGKICEIYQYVEFSEELFIKSIKDDYLKLFEYLLERKPDDFSINIVREAVKNGSEKILLYITEEKGYSLDDKSYSLVLKHSVSVLKFLVEKIGISKCNEF